MVSESAKKATRRYITDNWDNKYKEYYHNASMEWRDANKEKYNQYLKQYMTNRYAFTKEVNRLKNICIF